MNRRSLLKSFALAGSVAFLRADENSCEAGPWDLSALQQPPEVSWVERKGMLRSLYYSGEPYRGNPTRVYAWCGFPEATKSKSPAMVLVHGGHGTAFREWAEIWAKRGYVGISMDLAGQGPDQKRMDDGGPDQNSPEKFDNIRNGLSDAWSYHAVASVLRAVSLLRSLPEVDPDRIGITGISWGGYLTCLAAGLDQRLKVAVPMYGCGFLHENSVWLKNFEKLGPEFRDLWVRNYDPSRYLDCARMPMLWCNGTNDGAYPLDSYQKSYRLVQPRTLCVTVRMPHNHPAGWGRVEVGLFVDSVLKGGKPLAAFEEVSRRGPNVAASFRASTTLRKAELHYTLDEGAWKERNWQSTPARLEGNHVEATLPRERGIVHFLTVTDERGAVVSTEHEVIA